MNKGIDPYNTVPNKDDRVEKQYEALEWEPQGRVRKPRVVEYNAEYWRNVWGWKVEENEDE